MSRFESFLAPQFEDYMPIGTIWAMTPIACAGCSKPLTATCSAQNAGPGDLTPAFFLTLRASLRTQYKSINRVLSTTRMFFQYLLRKDVLPG